ncbi:MAG: malonyl-CoA decarboxylase [Pseudomonadota bacterium]
MADTFFQSLFTSIADGGRDLISRNLRRTERDPADHVIGLCRALVSSHGEASGAALAMATLDAYRGLSAEERARVFHRLVAEFCADEAAVVTAYHAYRADPSPATLVALVEAAEPPRRELLGRLNIAPGGTADLVRMRGEVLKLLPAEDDLTALDSDLQHLFVSWFNRGFLSLERIDWHTAAAVLEKLIAYEAVHEIDGWEDLRRRLAADRRCFAFFHPALPDEPLIFVQVALVRSIPDRVQPLLDRSAPVFDVKQADTAVFFSISNCQPGLRSISFGNFLIKQVAADLQAELPNLKTFVTLSPIPGFSRWLHGVAQTNGDGELHDLLADLDGLADADWQEAERTKALEEPLTQLAAWYLVREKKGTMPLDPVARFHLGNGARLERINWRGDVSAKGLRHGHGLMVNYLYRLDQVERNHEAFVNDKKVVASRAVDQLVKASPWPGKETGKAAANATPLPAV